MSKARCNYHHGDLRNALITAAAALIERDNSLEFSMAEAAAKAGVSAAAPRGRSSWSPPCAIRVPPTPRARRSSASRS